MSGGLCNNLCQLELGIDRIQYPSLRLTVSTLQRKQLSLPLVRVTLYNRDIIYVLQT